MTNDEWRIKESCHLKFPPPSRGTADAGRYSIIMTGGGGALSI
ncbi:hypothetical protein D1AOALGA4SA_10053 [Olavius algarvensis Delta 1 endosymbiont]|nr:hypothetical protein D1AOALGA4SA_10053 [Olavius algarvensis Delta 1 endosymbiont]